MAHGSEEHCDGAGEYLFEVIDAAGCSIPWIGRRDSGGVRCSMTMYGGLCECEAARGEKFERKVDEDPLCT